MTQVDVVQEKVESTGPLAFSFGDPEPVLQSNLVSMLGTFLVGNYYEPPIPFDKISVLWRQNPYSESAVIFKSNALKLTYVPNNILDRATIEGFIKDYIVFGNGYLQKVTNMFGQLLFLRHVPTRNMRRMRNLTQFLQINDWNKITEYKDGEIIWVGDYSTEQQIYGMPCYIGAMQSIWLSESATTFRRRYYINGAHMGYVFYVNDPKMHKDDEENIKKQLQDSKDPGNFRCLFYNNRSADSKEAIKIMQIGELGTKDDFATIKNISRNEILTSFRIPPSLMGILPENVGGFGDVEKAAMTFGYNEIRSLQLDLSDAINAYLPRQYHITFTDYRLPTYPPVT